MTLHAVVYISEACREIAEDGRLGLGSGRLDELVDDAARFNREAGVTGVLLFDGQRFFQYLEGPEDGLRLAYGRAQSATSHTCVVTLHEGPLSIRIMPFWPMRWIPADGSHLRALAAADWEGFRRGGEPAAGDPAGMDIVASVVSPYLQAT